MWVPKKILFKHNKYNFLKYIRTFFTVSMLSYATL
jgi:hypothetical protein